MLWLTLAPPALAGDGRALVLRDDTRVHDVWPALTVLEDAAGSLTIEQVLSDARGFAPSTGPYANFGVRRGALWLRVPVEVPASESGRWLLDIDYASIDQADLYVISDGRVVHQVRLGDAQAFAQRPLPTRSHAAPLVLERGQDHELMLRVQTTSSSVLPIKLWQADAYYAQEASTQALQALLAGVWVCLCLYSLTQWLVLRDLMFGYYALTILGTGLFFISYFGMGPQHLWGGNAWMTQNMAPLAVLIGLLGGLLFVDRTLDVPQMSRRAALVVRTLALAAGLTALAFLLDLIPYRAAHTIATALGLSPMLIAVPVAYLRWRGGDRAAAYMLCGWLIYAIGAGHQALLLRGLLDVTFWTQHAFQFGSMAEMALWMMVLGARIDEIRAKAEAAHRERDRLHSLAHTDALTGLLNRRGLQAAVDGMLRASTPMKATAVYLLDLDGFKPVNDTLGHDAGDELLRQVGERLKAQLRASDLVARLGGDEFVVAVGGLPGEGEADAVGRKLLQAFQGPFGVMGQHCRVGLTIGYAIAPLDGHDLASLLKRADAAMYAGKQAGKNRVQRGGASAGLVAG
jgi:diguanylate cyclase (GGDEF)-like protein